MIHVSHSRLKVARRCWRKHHYRYNERIQTKAKAAPLLRGSILHEMIDALTEKKDPFAVSRRYAKEYRSLFREQREEYGETFIQDIDRVFQGYLRAYAKDPLKYVQSEYEGKLQLSRDVELVYIIDKIATDKEGRRWLVDHKTHKNIPEEEARFSDIQLVLYYWAWNEQHPKEKLDGIIWDYLRTKPPTVPEPLKKGGLSIAQNMDTDYYTYVQAAATHGIDVTAPHYVEFVANLKKRGSMDFFQRITLPAPSPEMIESVVEDARETSRHIDKLGSSARARNLTKDCRWDCEYYRLCHAELRGLDADFVRKTDYEEREPDERSKEAS